MYGEIALYEIIGKHHLFCNEVAKQYEEETYWLFEQLVDELESLKNEYEGKEDYCKCIDLEIKYLEEVAQDYDYQIAFEIERYPKIKPTKKRVKEEIEEFQDD